MTEDLLPRLQAALQDRYRIERPVGAGGMATVYLAHDLKHDRRVAVKVLRPELAAVLGAERFLREIRITASLSHPHILPLLDSGSIEPQPTAAPPSGHTSLLYYVMPYVEGESLRQRLRREKQLPIGEAIKITEHVASALTFAHNRGVVHRDIKPENILLCEAEAMVADFGIAVAVNAAGAERLTETGFSLGTPEYMSPEQVMGDRELDARSDVYSLGCVLYEMLSGAPPFSGPTPQAILARRVTEQMPSLRSIRDTVPPAVEKGVETALAKSPADRFATAEAFGRAVREGAVSTPVTQRTGRRLVMPLLAAVGAVAVLVALLVVAPARGPSAGAVPTLAVLRFTNMSGLQRDEYFTEGIREQIVAQLSKVGGLSVRGLTSAMEYRDSPKSLREIGQELNARYLLGGSVLRDGETVRTTVHLVDAQEDVQVWADNYDHDLSLENLLAVHSGVAKNVARALQAELTPDERTRIEARPTDNLRAYNFYLLGQYHWNRFGQDDLEKSIDYFEQAIAEDSTFARAFAGLADAYVALALGHGTGEMNPAEAILRARPLVVRALEIDDELSEAHMVRGFIKHTFDYEYTEAERELRRAIELSPSNAQAYTRLGLLLQNLGRHDEAIAAGRRAQELDPLSPIITTDLGFDLICAGRLDEALSQASAVIDRAPEFRPAHLLLCHSLTMMGDHVDAIPACETAWDLSENPGDLARLAWAQALAGNESDASRIEDQLREIEQQRYVSPLAWGWLYAGMGEDELAIEWLRRGVETRTGWITKIGCDPTFAHLRDHPEFQDLLARLNLN